MSEPPAQAARISTGDDDVSDIRVASAAAVPPDSLLSFKVYTLAELERRSDAPMSMRVSKANLDTTASSRNAIQWTRLGQAFKAFAIAARDWFKTDTAKAPRPSIKIALRQPFDLLGDELQRVVEAIDWKKLGVTTGIVVGATLTLLFAVLTAAELTDDLKPPGAAAHLASTETSPIPAKNAVDSRGVAPATNMAAMGVQPVAAAPAPATLAPAVTAIGDIDDDNAPPSATPTAKKPARKAGAGQKPKSNKLTFRNADAVFKQ